MIAPSGARNQPKQRQIARLIKCFEDNAGATMRAMRHPTADMPGQRWQECLAAASPQATLAVDDIADAGALTGAVADLVTGLQHDGRQVLIVVPDDALLPECSAALDLALRPLCLVLPGAEFAARIALRATLSLLKSRLARDGDDEQSAPWQAQRARLAAAPGRWQAAQAWNARNDRTPWPRDVTMLFPVCIVPLAAWRAMPARDFDMAVFVRCRPDPLPSPARMATLLVGHAQAASMAAGPLVAIDAQARLLAELAQLTQDVGELELELATAQAEMSEFTRRYYRLVGRRMAEADALQAKLAARRADATTAPEAQEAARAAQARADGSSGEQARFSRAAGEAPDLDQATTAAGFRLGNDVKRLFRQLAQKIHPDRCVDEADRAWRTQLMSEANRAYRAGDLAGLREVAALWAEGQPAPAQAAMQAQPAPATGLEEQVARMRARFDAIKAELGRLFGSKLYELFLAARQALRHGRDLLQEMADRLDAQIADLLAALRTA